jgi:hypothetical protein
VNSTGGPRRWTAVTRSALGFAALGAGLLHLALAVDAPVGLAVGLAVVGGVEFLWGVLAVSLPGVPLPRAAIAGALVPAAAWVVLLLLGVEGPRPLPMLAATVLGLAVAALLAIGLRRENTQEPRHPALGIAVAGLAVAAITVPALIATEVPQRLGDLPVHQEPAH